MNGPKAEQDKTDRATGLSRRTRGDIEKWDQTENAEIPDRGETLEIPSLLSGYRPQILQSDKGT